MNDDLAFLKQNGAQRLYKIAKLLLFAMISYLVWEGIGIWGLNNPVGWGYAIVNFVFWVGIGHAGTLISAILSDLEFWFSSFSILFYMVRKMIISR